MALKLRHRHLLKPKATITIAVKFPINCTSVVSSQLKPNIHEIKNVKSKSCHFHSVTFAFLVQAKTSLTVVVDCR